jgi:sRNA-binding carbon storage regulator CsrA
MALVLSQTLGDGPIHIVASNGEHVTIDLMDIQRSQCRYAISAPDSVKIDRDTIYNRKQNGIPHNKENRGNR